MNHKAQKLESEIARAISLIVTASHAAAVEALNEVFGQGARPRRKEARGAISGQSERDQGSPPSSHRSRAEIQALEEQLLQAVQRTPGETMTVIATELGVTAVQLATPAARLKSSRRIKSVGERQFTRYFPIEHGASAEG